MHQETVRILVAEDEKASRFLLKTLLSRLEAVEPVCVSNGQEAIEQLSDHEFALAILDISMPEVNGFDVARWMRKNAGQRTTPILFLTAIYKDQESIADGYELGAVDYLFKPFDANILQNKVKVFVELYRSRKARECNEQALIDQNTELERTRKRFYSLFEHLPVGMAIYEPVDQGEDFIIRDINPAGQRISGCDIDEIRGRLVTDAFPGIVEMGLLDVFREVWRQDTPRQLDAAQYRDGQTMQWFENTVYKLPFGELVAVYSDITERKESEIKIRHSEERLNGTLDAINEGVWDWRLDTGEVFFSPRYYTMLGYEPGEFEPSYDSFAALVHPDDIRRLEQEVHETLIKGEAYAVELRLKTKSGDWKWILTRGRAAEYDADGQPVRLLGTHMDITATKQSEEELRKSRSRMALAQRIANMGSWERNTITGQGFWSDNMYRLFGYEPGEVAPTMDFLLSRVLPEDRPAIDKALQSPDTETKAFHVEYRIRRKDGVVRECQSAGVVEADPETNAPMLYGVLHDITERKQAEREKQKNEATLHRIQQLANLGSWERHVDSDEVWWADQTYAIFGYQPGEIHPSIDFLKSRVLEEDWHAIDSLRQRSRKESGSFEYHFRLRRKDGQIRHVHAEGGIEFDSKTDGPVLVGLLHDVTEQVEARNALLESEALLNKMGAMARVGGWELDIDSEKQRWTKETYRIHEVEPDFEPELESSVQFYTPQHRPVIAEALQACMDDGQPFDLELQLVTAKGRKLWVRTMGEPRVEVDRIASIGGTLQDITEQKESLDAIRHSEERFRSLYESIRDAIFVVDREQILVDCNSSFTDLFGYSLKDLREKPALALYVNDADHRRLVGYSHYSNSVDEQSIFTVSYRKKSGEVFPGETNVFSLLNPQGDVTGSICLVRDVSERLKAEAAVRESELRWRNLLQSLQTGVLVYTPGLSIVTYNAAACSLLGITPAELLSTPPLSPDWPLVRQDGTPMPPEEYPVQQVLTRRKPLHNHVVGIISPGNEEITWGLVNANPVFADNGELTEIILAFVDITEARHVEEELRYSRMLLRKTFESLAEAVFIVDSTTYACIDCNPAATDMFGYSREELLGDKVDKLHFNDDFRRSFRDQLKEEVEEKGFLHLPKYYLRRKSGEVFISEHYVTPITSDSGERVAWVSVVRDVTQQRRAEEQLKQRTFELEVLNELSRKLGYTLNFDDVVHLLIENLPQVLELDVAAGMLMKDDTPKVFTNCSAKLSGKLQLSIAKQMGAILNHFEDLNHMHFPEYFPGVVCTSYSDEEELITELQSTFLVPLFETEGELAGVLFVGSRKASAYNAEQVGLVYKVVEQVSASIGRLRALVDEHLQELGQMVHSMPSGIVLLDSQCRVVMANPRGTDKILLLAGKHPGDILTELGGMPMEEVLARALAEDSQLQLEHHGDKRSVFRIAGRQLQAGPQAGGYVISILDITKEQEDAEKILASERRFRTIFDNASDAIFVHDLEGRILDVNDVVCERLEYTRSELSGYPLSDLTPEDLRGKLGLASKLRNIQANGFTFFETIQQRRSGGLVPTEINARLIEYEGSPAILSTARNITERKQAEQERAEHEALLNAILTGIQAAFFIIDPMNMLVADINEKALELLDRSKVDLLGHTCSEVLNLSICKMTSCKECISSGSSFLGREAVLILDNGDSIPVAVNHLHLRKSGRRFMVIILFDISEQKALELQLSHAQKLESIGQLAAGIAHEINTPVQYVAGNITFLKSSFDKVRILLERYKDLQNAIQAKEDLHERAMGMKDLLKSVKLDFLLEEVPQAIEDSQEGLDRVAKIVQAMKKFSHPDVGELKLVKVNDAIESTVTVARNEWKYDSNLYLELAEDLPPIYCVPGDFNQAILNVLVNAAHANTEKHKVLGGKGVITISTSHMGDIVEIRISDNGKGIPEKFRTRIFDPFFTTKEVGKGTGQGLAITHSIVDKHGGTIGFETQEGEGTTFILRFPLDPPMHQKGTQ